MSRQRNDRESDLYGSGVQVSRTVARLRKVTGVDLTFSGAPSADALRLNNFDGPIAGPLRSAVLETGHGLGGRVLVQQRLIALHDYVSAPSIVHTYDAIIRAERLRAMVAAPVIVGRQIITVLYAAARTPQVELGRLFDLVASEARALEQTLAVAAALSYQATDTPAPPPDQWRRRADIAYGELRALAATVPDPEIQVRIRDAADRLIRDENPPGIASVYLTAREIDVLALVASGQSNNAIAEGLGIGLYTVKGHVKNLMAKFEASSRFEVVVKARQYGRLP